MPIACAPTVGRETSKVCIAVCDFERVPSRARASFASSFSLPPSRQRPGTRQSSRKTSAVCDARRPCFLTFVPCVRPGVPGGMTNAAWPREPSSRSTRGHDDVDARDAAVRGPGLLPVEDPLVLRLVVLAVVRRAETSEPASGSETQNARPWLVERCRSTAGSTRPSARACRSRRCRDRERRAHDRHPDARVAPEELLVDDRHRQPVGSAQNWPTPRIHRGRSSRPPG